MNQQPTGDPSIDKPWMKHYSNEDKNWSVKKCKIHEYIYEKNREYLDDTALIYMGKNTHIKSYLKILIG